MREASSNRSDYRIEEELLRQGGRIVYRARRLGDGRSLLLETVPDRDDTGLLKRAHGLLQKVDVDAILAPLGLESIDGVAMLVYDDPGGYFLGAQLKDYGMAVQDFLDIALPLAESLHRVHEAGIVHRGIQPACLYVDPYASGIRLTGFLHATDVLRTPQRISPYRFNDGSLAYMAPEQTGRMNRPVDWRTDLYSTGIVFYRLLTGVLPFRSEHPLELVHSHLAFSPEPLEGYNPAILPAVSAIVLKLLAKDPADRFRSAVGLIADLRRCRDELSRLGTIEAFPLGEDDPIQQLEIPDRLYGREDAIGEVLAAFERIRTGAVEMLVVSGSAGVGKTSLVLEVQKPILQARGYFAAGKFDQLNRVEPYSALIQSLNDLVGQLLTESDEAVGVWRKRITMVLGGNARVILDVVPDLELVIGPQPAVARLGSTESRNRLELQFQRLVQVLARRDHPLVLFLDDLQWADTASVDLIVSLLAHAAPESFLLIGAYRENEVDARHPLMLAFRDLVDAGGTVTHCRLGSLQPAHVVALLADTLNESPEKVRELAALVYDKTFGNPFFIRAFLAAAFANGLIRQHRGEGWRWSTTRIAWAQPTDNVVDLLAARIDQLPPDSRGLLELAACIGNRFDVPTLVIATDASVDTVQRSLMPPLREGLIESHGKNRYAFCHDRIQEAAYRRIPAERRARLHYEVGTLLLQTPGELTNERLFEIADHIDQALELSRDTEESSRFAELNRRAADCARQSAAFEAAYSYYDHGIRVLGDAGWSQQYDLAFSLHIGRAEVAFLCGRADIAESDTEQLLVEARTDLQRGEVYALKMIQFETGGRFADAVAAGRTVLALFGLHFPSDPAGAEQAIDSAVADIRRCMAGRSIQSLAGLPEMQRAETRMSMRLLMILWPSAYISGDKTLTVLIASRMVLLSLQHGNAPESAYGYVTHAITLGALMRDYTRAYEFGRLALDVNRRFDDLRSRAKVNHMFSCYVGLWCRPIEENFAYSREAYRAGLESGDFVYAAYGCFHESWHAMFSGMNLQRYHDEYAEKLGFLDRAGNRSFFDAHQLMLHWGMALQGRTESVGGLGSPLFDESAYLREYRHTDFFIAFHHIASLSLSYTFGDFQAARSMAPLAERAAPGVRGMIWDAWLCLYGALSLTAPRDGATDLTAEQHRQLDEKIRLMGIWAQTSPASFSHQLHLLRAEQAFVNDRIADAIDAYEAAIAGATEAGFNHHQALAKERYGEFWLSRNKPRLARVYIEDALADYGHWGAAGKVDQLAQRHSALLGDATGRRSQEGRLTDSDPLDSATIIHATRALSEEIDTGRLAHIMLTLLIQAAGAQRAILFDFSEGDLSPTLEARVGPKGPIVEPLDPRDWKDGVAEKALNYVRHTQRSLLVGDASQDERLVADTYVANRQLRSIICAPVLNQAEMEGLIYLENDQVNDAFTPDRLALVEVLAAQAAISLKNARLIRGLQHEAQKRERAELRLKEVATATAAAVGENFFQELVLQLSRVMNKRVAFVTECLAMEPNQVKALAFIDSGRLLEDVEYELDGTPCKEVLDGSVCFFPNRLEDYFPREKGLESYLGVPMFGTGGDVVGHLAVADDSPMEESPDDLSLLKIFAIRASTELERQRAQAEAIRVQRKMSERERLASIGEFASMIAHEIRSPLSTIAMALEFVERDSPSEKSGKRIELATLESNRLQALLSEILLFAKPQMMNRERVDLEALTASCVERLTEVPASERRTIDFHCQAVEPIVNGDRDKLTQVLINLITNACQAISKDDVVSVELSGGAPEGNVRIVVRNPGGIPEQDLAKLTEPFYTTKSRGTGLGLAIVKRIVESHEGQLIIRSDPQQGVCVEVILPVGDA